jgi:hypothetical protein
MATIVVTDLSNISVDGTPAGSVVDVLANYGSKVPGLRGALLRAVKDWHDGHRKSIDDAVAALKAEHETALAGRDAVIADLQSQIEALGGMERARQLQREVRIKAAREAKERAEKELADLDSEGSDQSQPSQMSKEGGVPTDRPPSPSAERATRLAALGMRPGRPFPPGRPADREES